MNIPSFKPVVKRTHRVYMLKDICPILEYLGKAVLPRGAIAKISKDTGIPDQTLRDWRKKRIATGGSEWYPQKDGHPKKRSLSRLVEDAIADLIKVNYIESGNGATRGDVAMFALNAYSSQDVSEIRTERFAASSRFIDGFIHRHRLSLRKQHRERRTTVDVSWSESYLNNYHELINHYPSEFIFNMDETHWAIVLGPRYILAEVGTETVKVNSNQNEKAGITAIATISSDGDKLPLWLIARGKSDRSLKKYGLRSNSVMKYSENGWVNECIMIQYIEWLSSTINGVPCALVLDVFSAHRSDAVKKRAEELDIQLLFVPAGTTGIFQPLDRRVFGELKSRARSEFGRLKMRNGSLDLDVDISLDILETCWGRISRENIINAWNLDQ